MLFKDNDIIVMDRFMLIDCSTNTEHILGLEFKMLTVGKLYALIL